ncbi:putative Superoxide dismutase [Streptomyces viridochromogenes Tue57]|uniref:Putative Superoxide dismutase n=1 Tax=Streptomyces viridochromogenes Tue57 TaxID=1160705 RepID=L8PJP2_STRVR|nr:putative Superoxide dismutase [Streptomyces viridochromogenes Tue57]
MRAMTSGRDGATLSPRPRTRLAACCAGLTAAALLLSGCGGGSSGSASADAAAAESSGPSQSMDDMAGMEMGDPSATPANKIPDAEVVKGSFKLLDTRPPGMDDVQGTAWLAQGPKGTTVTVSLTGLKPGEKYMSHLHGQPCSTKGGGEHFQFDKGGATTPPNEVHLMFTTDKSGMGMTTVNNDRKTGENAVAIVVHPMAAQDNRIACADFDF